MKKILTLVAVAALSTLAACQKSVPATEAAEAANVEVTDVATGEVVEAPAENTDEAAK